MKQLEYGHYDIASNETEIKDLIAAATKYQPDIISVFPHYLKLAKNHIGNSILGCVIDYPLGLLDLKSRLMATEFAIKSGAALIELVAPTYSLCNRKYDKFREDVKCHLELCQENNVELRYIVEYRVFTLELLYKIAQILVSFGIKTMYPSTGYSLDDINDNLLACALINKKNTDIKLIANGNIWNDKQIDTINKNVDLYGLKCHSINSLQKIYYSKHNIVQ
jgi:deoxyribose-phosphate aldolase